MRGKITHCCPNTPSPCHRVHASEVVFVLLYLTVSYRFMTYYLSLHNFCLFTSAIDFNVVNPSNNTFHRKKIIMTIFANETKCIFEKNYKKTTPKLTPNLTPKNDSKLHSKKKDNRHDDICVSQHIEHLIGVEVGGCTK